MPALLVRALLAIVVGACGSGGEAGDACDSNGACDTNRCVTGGSFPEGICTPTCANNQDCPDGFSCISRSSGMCLPDCTSTAQCQDLRGDAWQCRDESLQGDGGGNVMVCIGA